MHFTSLNYKKNNNNRHGILSIASYLGMESFQKNVYLLTKKEITPVVTLGELAKLRKGEQYQKGVIFYRDMNADGVKVWLENVFSSNLSNKR